MDELRDWDAVRTAAAIAAGEVTTAEVVAARARAAHGLAGRLGGVPTVVKEMFGVAGAPLRHGSRALEGVRAEHTSAAAQQYLDTGVVAIATDPPD